MASARRDSMPRHTTIVVSEDRSFKSPVTLFPQHDNGCQRREGQISY
ncbi:MAG TPA: hypothetical protein VKR28_04890 [Candidatus Binatus sp.]|nr:hypothetical protein [Candidatus Binatus sp.]